ncbi:uncharacterized protein K441DRAFT_671889 [Cenococcum geophilum 1.58]|uniref:Uncharacterized protein n=1 Tax=Cenococcum geophilum 1.58 TaxID=794803 RepID=A0ACC8EKN7_9PEZI|nr:hypothetical protein K441DRAFT_671889 [Cenococcum geophilum 1.58]
MKNPDLLCPSVAAALRAYGYVLSSLDLGLANRLPYGRLLYLDHPLYAISYNYCVAIYALPSPP